MLDSGTPDTETVAARQFELPFYWIISGKRSHLATYTELDTRYTRSPFQTSGQTPECLLDTLVTAPLNSVKIRLLSPRGKHFPAFESDY